MKRSSSKYEKTHTELSWYGIPVLKTLFTVMGTGCKSVVQVDSPNTDLVVGTWDDGRIGTFRGIHDGKQAYGGIETRIPPVSSQETLEICAFMEAAYESKKNKGVAVTIESMFKKAMAAR